MSRSATRWQPTARTATSLAHGPVNPATGLTAAQEEALRRVYALILPPYWEIPSVVAAIKAANAEQAAKDAAAAEAAAAADTTEAPDTTEAAAPTAPATPADPPPPISLSPSLPVSQSPCLPVSQSPSLPVSLSDPAPTTDLTSQQSKLRHKRAAR